MALSLGASAPASDAAAQRCTAVFFLTVPATPGQIAAVKARLRNDSEVVGFRFVSRAEAFEQLRRRFPDLTEGLPSNPLPARLHVQLTEGVSPRRFVSRYQALRLRGVAVVKTVPASQSSCREVGGR